MNIALDMLTVVVLAICVYGGLKKGFVETLMNLVGSIAALILAFMFSGTLGQMISAKWISPFFEKSVLNMLSNFTSAPVNDAASVPIEKLLSEGGKAFQNLLSKFGVSGASVQQSMDSASQNLAVARENAVKAIYQPAADAISHFIAFLLIFVLVLVAVFILTKLLNGIFSLPILSGVNKMAGLAIGAFQGLLIVCGLSLLIGMAIPYAGSMGAFGVSERDIENSLIFRPIHEANPLRNLLTSPID